MRENICLPWQSSNRITVCLYSNRLPLRVNFLFAVNMVFAKTRIYVIYHYVVEWFSVTFRTSIPSPYIFILMWTIKNKLLSIIYSNASITESRIWKKLCMHWSLAHFEKNNERTKVNDIFQKLWDGFHSLYFKLAQPVIWIKKFFMEGILFFWFNYNILEVIIRQHTVNLQNLDHIL